MNSVEDYLDEASGELLSQGRRQQIYYDGQEQEVNENRYLDVEEVKGKLAHWIRED